MEIPTDNIETESEFEEKDRFQPEAIATSVPQISPETIAAPSVPSFIGDPSPWDIDRFINDQNKGLPGSEAWANRRAFAETVQHFARPFEATGYNAAAALNRGLAGFSTHLDHVAGYIEKSGLGERSKLFENAARVYEENADFWKQRADEVGSTFLDELIGEAVGGFAPGVSTFTLDLGSALTIPYMDGAYQASEKGESPFAAGIVNAAKTGVLGQIFRMIHPLKQYLRAPIMGSIFGMEEMAGAPEGQKTKAFVKGMTIGAGYSASSPGGRIGLNKVVENFKEMNKSLGESGQIDISYIVKLMKRTDPAIQKAIEFQKKIDETVTGGRTELAQNPDKPFFEDNAEYALSADPDVLCQKSRGCDLAIQKLKEELGKTYRPEIAYEFVARAKEQGLRVACPQCYLRSARDKPGTAMQKRIILGEGGYKGEIQRMTDADVADIPSQAIRNYSSTDFKPTHLPGQIAQKVESAEKGMAQGAYTKTTAYAEIFGPTGEYINMSVGRDELTGMNKADADLMRSKHPNVGEVGITYTAKETFANKKDPTIDHIIPWHNSGKSITQMKKELNDTEVIDHTGSQNETQPRKGGGLEKADWESRGRKHPDPGEYGWDLQKYLDICRDNNVIPKFPQYLMDEASYPKIMEVLEKVKQTGNVAHFWNFVTYNGQKIDPNYLKFVGPEYGKFMGEFPYKPADMTKVDLQLAERKLVEYLRDPESLIPRKQDYMDIADQIIKEYKGAQPKPSLMQHFKEKMKDQTGAISFKKKPRKFIKRVAESGDLDTAVEQQVKEIDPQDYVVQPNQESLGLAKNRIQTTGILKSIEYATSKEPMNAEKGATFISLIKHFEKQGDWDRATDMVDAYDLQLREAGRFVQAASMISTLSAPMFIRWSNKRLDSVRDKYGYIDRLLRPEMRKSTIQKTGESPFTLSKEEMKVVFERFREIQKMPEGPDRADAVLTLIDDVVAKKVPPSVSEWIDAFRNQNMLSGWKTQLRNIESNMVNTFITRPADLVSVAALDYVKSFLTGKERQHWISDVPSYLKGAANSVPNAVMAFKASLKLARTTTIEKPELGVEAKTEFERARVKQLPISLQLVSRFMEACDKFNSCIIASGEMAYRKKHGATDVEAYQAGQEIAQTYLLRDRLDPNDPKLSYPSRFLSSLGHWMEMSRSMPVLGTVSKWYMPFIRTPVNFGIQMIEHSPFGFARPKAGMTVENLAKPMVGAVITALGSVLAMTNETTWNAPSNEQEKALFYATGRKPFSVKVGDRWIPLWYLGPLSLGLALPIAAKHFWTETKESMTESGTEKLFDIARGVAQFIGSQTSVQNVGALFSALDGDIDFKFSSQTGFTMTQMIPGSSFVRWVNSMIDPVYRKPKGFLENIEKDLPFLSQQLEARTYPDLMGGPGFEEIRREPINYFLPWDLGKAEERFEAQYDLVRMQKRMEYFNKIMKGTKDMTPEERSQNMIENLPNYWKAMEGM